MEVIRSVLYDTLLKTRICHVTFSNLRQTGGYMKNMSPGRLTVDLRERFPLPRIP